MVDSPEVLVMGGGPAGAAAARLLSLWGHEVVLVERGVADEARSLNEARSLAGSRSLAESLPPSSRKVLAATGMLGVVEAGGFHRNGGNTALWGGEGRRDDFAGGATGFHVLRSRFDSILRQAAVEAGAILGRGVARLGDGIAAQSGARGDTGPDAQGEAGLGLQSRDEPWPVEIIHDDGSITCVRPQWLLDCTGRAGVLARHWRVAESEAPTLAIVRRYRAEGGWQSVEESHALVESFARGWAWSVPTSTEERHVAVMLDPSLQAVVGSARAVSGATRVGSAPEVSDTATDITATFEAEIAGTELMRTVIGAAKPQGPAWAVTASMYGSSNFAPGRALLVGDAASFADPMSSYGVKKALASAWLASVTVHTALRTPDLAPVACDFFAKRERAMYDSLREGLAVQVAGTGAAPSAGTGAGTGTDTARSTDAARPADAARSDDAFWDRRARWLADRTGLGDEANVADGPSASALRDDTEVRAAFHALRLGSGRLRTLPRKTVDRPMVMGNRIRLAPALATPRFPDGVRFFRDIDLLRVVHLAPAAENPGALYDAYSDWAAREDMPPVDLASFVGVVALLIADGVLAAGAAS